MIVGQAGLSIIKSYETLRLTAYFATESEHKRNIWSIGWGHTHSVKEFDTCTPEKADAWLLEDIAEAADCVNHHVTAGINQNQFDALVSLVYNIGTTNFVTSHLLKYLIAGDFGAAASEFPKWDHQDGKVLAGLTKRRNTEKVLFETPV